MTIAAIETAYAGCRFRSRLEARWAVFFDHLSIRWEYEPQGYEFDGQRYLPDFWLADHDLAVEVKGVMNQAGARKISGFAANGHGVIILGDIPRPGVHGPHHWLVDGRTGITTTWAVSLLPSNRNRYEPFPFGWPRAVLADDPELASHLAQPPVGGIVLESAMVTAAYTAARSARFEHGQTPSAPSRLSAPPPRPSATVDTLGTSLVTGDHVEHDEYGRGDVADVDDSGGRAIITVEFSTGTVRFMALPNLPLRLVTPAAAVTS